MIMIYMNILMGVRSNLFNSTSFIFQQDYEVALSLGHLASLYNYDMERYDKAEELYLRSIEIGG